jgi:hypothetical protein
MALTAEQLKALSALADYWLAAGVDERIALVQESEVQGAAFAGAFNTMIA